MTFEIVLLGAIIFIFIVSFCGLLQKIKQTYDRERIIAERLARRREQRVQRNSDPFEEVYINPAFTSETNGVIFPTAPPPYSQYYVEPPPKYDEVIKVHEPKPTTNQNETTTENQQDTGPPPYTITLTTEVANRY